MFKVLFSSYFINDAENSGVRGYHLTPLCEGRNLNVAIKQAYAHVARINSLMESPGTEEAHTLQIIKGDQIYLMASITSKTDPDGFRFFDGDSISWDLPMCDVEVTNAVAEIKHLEKWSRNLCEGHIDKDTHQVTIELLKAKVNYSETPMARTTLQATLYRAEEQLGRKPSTVRHFLEELGM